MLPFRSNIPKISEFAFEAIDPTYHRRALEVRETGGHAVVAGRNYGQGSSREHAALAPRYLGLRLVIAKGFARIHRQNLVNFGVLPLTLVDEPEYDRLAPGDILEVTDLHRSLAAGPEVRLENVTKGYRFSARHELSEREVEVLLAGGLINWVRARLAAGPRSIPLPP